MMSTLPTAHPPNRLARAVICVALMALAIAWLYRTQIMNGFTVMAGDRYDGVISTVIMEHWYKVFIGKAHWAEVGYFFPYTRTIAQSDAYFLLGILYTPFRLLGVDQFVSAELVNMVVKGIGFTAAYVMCRRVFALPFYWSLLAATLFTLSNGMTIHSSRSQLATVAFAPLMILLLWNAGKALATDQASRFRKHGVLAGLLFGAWCMSCFYVSWFFCFFTLVLLLVAAWRGGRPGLALAARLVLRHRASVLLVLGVTLLALLPFFYAFIPKARETGTRDFAEALIYTVRLPDIFQVGQENLFLGKLYNAVLLALYPAYQPIHEYNNTGIAIVLFIAFAAGARQLYRRRGENRDFFLVCIMLATFITWAFTIKIGRYSLWYIPFHLVPGGRALRIVAAYYIFLALPIIVIAVRYLASRKLAWPAILAVTALLVVEELNAPALGLSRQDELARIALPNAPPQDCRVFYVSAWKGQSTWPGPADIYAHNVSAMMIAQEVGLPTVNGVASFQQRDWDFDKAEQADYDARVASYASKHGLGGLCRLDLNDKTWKMIPQSDIRPAARNVNFFQKSDWPGGITDIDGMSGPESWGAWSDGDRVKLDFTEPLPERFALRLTANAFAYNIGKEFIVQLGKPGAGRDTEVAGKFVLGSTEQEQTVVLDNPRHERMLTIKVPHPVAPSELGASDSRRLGIAVHKMQILPLPAAASAPRSN